MTESASPPRGTAPPEPAAEVPANGAESGDRQLIRSIYMLALEPDSYDLFMQNWGAHLHGVIERLREVQKRSDLTDPEIQQHFSICFSILEQLDRQGRPRPSATRGPRFLIDHDGAVVWFNGLAAGELGLTRTTTLDDLPLDPDTRTRIAQMLRQAGAAQAGAEIRQLALKLSVAGAPLHLVARRLHDAEARALVLVEPVTPDWPEGLAPLLRRDFGLTEAETVVALGLAEGRNVTRLAESRGASVATVRAQVKSLLAKTATGSQTDLVRLVLSLSRMLDAEAQAPAAAPVPPPPGRPAGALKVVTAGPPDGLPVVFLHGMLDGVDLTPPIRRALDRAGLRLIAPVRPWFGDAGGDEGPVATAPERFAALLRPLVDGTGPRRVVLLGHMAGSVYAFAAAGLLGPAVAGIVSVAGGVPILSASQFAVMSPRQRLVAYTARYAPAALPFVLRAGIRQLHHGGERAFMEALYETSPRDRAVVATPGVFEALRAGYHFAVAQGHTAFAVDSYQVVRDWSRLVGASTAPVTLVHGRHDPVVSAASVEAFAARLGGRARLEMVEDCGQLVWFARPEMVCQAVLAQFRQAAGGGSGGGP